MSQTHLVTGATGFVGGALVLELLARTNVRVACIVRGQTQADAQRRLEQSLAHAAQAYGQPEVVVEIARRCTAVAGDILRPLCGAAGVQLGDVAEVWHAAASLKYKDEHRDEIFQHNLEGTGNVLALAEALGAKTFNYISTAYVAGDRTGLVHETLPESDAHTNNQYEKSKIQAERRVAATTGMRTRILRPSIVVGHSRTLAATSFSGMYGFVRDVGTFKRAVSRRLGDILSHRAVRVRADRDALCNMIPVDAVARNAVAISLSGSTAQIFHLTNDCPPLMGLAVDLIFDQLGLRRPRFVTSPLELTSIDEKLDKELGFYSSYILQNKVFDRSNADAVLGADSARHPLDSERYAAYVRWYLDHLAKEKAASVAAANDTSRLADSA
jgi:nucleoside-diphosphate-sugar epimerase